jgi:hypothetical protein
MGTDKKFEWFPVDTPDPCGKYKQPIDNSNPVAGKNAWGGGSGYPIEDIDKDGVMVKGQWPAGTKTKTRAAIQGKGAATKGYKFYPDD